MRREKTVAGCALIVGIALIAAAPPAAAVEQCQAALIDAEARMVEMPEAERLELRDLVRRAQGLADAGNAQGCHEILQQVMQRLPEDTTDAAVQAAQTLPAPAPTDAAQQGMAAPQEDQAQQQTQRALMQLDQRIRQLEEEVQALQRMVQPQQQ